MLCREDIVLLYINVLTKRRADPSPLSMGQVQAARSAARQAGVPEHVVTGVRLRLKSPDDAAEEGCSEGTAGPVSANGQEASCNPTGSPAADEPDRADAATVGAAESTEPARQPSSPSDGPGNDAQHQHSANTATYTARAGEGGGPLCYHLVAVVVHHGGPESGHYTTFRCVGAQRQWFLTSDVNVWPVAESVVMGSEATLLLYEQDTVRTP